mmetsp:Transcript_45337/g.117367  ORF Transcript_45337/g.117367 Transcript_45337/m.117367 type:complete len:221 (-) Transcript_45337:466-1128(-)
MPSAMLEAGVPGSHLSPQFEEYTVISGDRSFSCRIISVRCLLKFSSAGFMSSVWKPAWQPLSSEIFCAPRSFARALTASTAAEVPESAKPQGKRRLPILHTPPLSATTSSHISSTSSSLRPTTEIIFCGSELASTAAFISSPRSLLSCTPSSKSKHLAAQRAASSPQETPAAAAASADSLPSCSRSHSMPHIEATKMATWHTSSSHSLSSGPISVTSKRS